MRKTNKQTMNARILPIIATFAALALAGCGGSDKVIVTEGDTQIGAARKGTVIVHSDSLVVHVDEFERLVTLRNARSFPKGAFLKTTNRDGEQTAILKTHDNREVGLRIADILEGEPKINNYASPVSAAESAHLSKIYRDAVEE